MPCLSGVYVNDGNVKRHVFAPQAHSGEGNARRPKRQRNPQDESPQGFICCPACENENSASYLAAHDVRMSTLPGDLTSPDGITPAVPSCRICSGKANQGFVGRHFANTRIRQQCSIVVLVLVAFLVAVVLLSSSPLPSASLLLVRFKSPSQLLPTTPHHHSTRDLAAGTCPLGCSSGNYTLSSSSSSSSSFSTNWCDDACHSAVALCNRGGSTNHTCFDWQPQTLEDYFNLESGWSNRIDCSGGILACELWTGAHRCNTTDGETRVVGLVLMDTATGILDFRLFEDSRVRLSAIHLYISPTPLPLGTNQSSLLSPEDLPQKFWYNPQVDRATVNVAGNMQVGDHFIAQITLCPSPSNIPSAAPTIILSAPVASPTLPRCPVPSPPRWPLVATATVTDGVSVAAEPSNSSGATVRSRQATAVGNLCASACREDLLSCDAQCQLAYAYCPDASPACLFGTNVTQVTSASLPPKGWTNAMPCFGGSFTCELWMGTGDCDRNSTGTAGTLIGKLVVNTDESLLDFSLSALNYALSSVHVQLHASRDSSSSLQQLWLTPNSKRVTMALNDPIRAEQVLQAQAVVCPNAAVSPQSPTSSPLPSIATDSPVTTSPLCPIGSPYGGTALPTPDLVLVPTLPPQLTIEPTSVADAEDAATNATSGRVNPSDTGTNSTDDGTNPTDDGTTASNSTDDRTNNPTGAPDVNSQGRLPTWLPTCQPQRTRTPSQRPAPLIVVPPMLRPHPPPSPSNAVSNLESSDGSPRPSQQWHRNRRRQRNCEPDADDDDDDDGEERPSEIPRRTTFQPSQQPSGGGVETQIPTDPPVRPTGSPSKLENAAKRPTKIPTVPPEYPTFLPTPESRNGSEVPSQQPILLVTGAPSTSRAPTNNSPKPSRRRIPTDGPSSEKEPPSKVPAQIPGPHFPTDNPRPQHSGGGDPTTPPPNGNPPSQDPPSKPPLVVVETSKPTTTGSSGVDTPIPLSEPPTRLVLETQDPTRRRESKPEEASSSSSSSRDPTHTTAATTSKPSKPKSTDEPTTAPSDEPTTVEPVNPTDKPTPHHHEPTPEAPR